MSKRRSTAPKPVGKPILVGILLAAVVFGGVLVARGGGSSKANGLPENETSFNVSTLAGEPAPAFTALGVDGQPYSVTPGDGRAKALIFYMGFR